MINEKIIPVEQIYNIMNLNIFYPAKENSYIYKFVTLKNKIKIRDIQPARYIDFNTHESVYSDNKHIVDTCECQAIYCLEHLSKWFFIQVRINGGIEISLIEFNPTVNKMKIIYNQLGEKLDESRLQFNLEDKRVVLNTKVIEYKLEIFLKRLKPLINLFNSVV